MAPSVSVASLFNPLKVGKCELKHRFAMSPMTRTRNDPETEAPREINVTYYAQRTSPGGLIVSEGTHPSAEAYGYIRAPGLYTQAMIDGWRKVTEAVHNKGGYIFCQIMHCGRVTHSSLLPNGMTPVAPSAVKMEGLVHIRGGKTEYETPRALETGEVEGVVQEHVEAAKKAIEAGFDGIEIHAGNGYLIQEFLALKTNQRQDKYGGSLENRCRFLLEIIDGCIAAIGEDRVSVKYQGGVSFSDLIEPESDVLEQLKYLGPEFSKRNLAYFCLSSLNYDPYYKIVGLSEPNLKTDVWKFFRALYSGTLMINGGLSPEKGAEYIADGTADLVAFGTPFIANANFPDLVKAGVELNQGGQNVKIWYGKDPATDEQGYTDWPLVEV
eukprot:TRINITY_DN31441_c0_g2_i4.p1 TRINITY_DN31441_c0_g2~~TRINITY_DN31441_c0_g2_i4.p1  ORF type:complete len:383 (+),score=78.33 TRINITY_DN31441_c0_g2_i4:120-1268(+)